MRYDFTLAGLVALTSLAWPLSNAKAMTFEQMKELLAAGVASDLVLEQYLAEPERFDPSSAQVLELKNAGATDALLRELISAKDSDVPHSTSRVTGDLDLYVDPFGYHVYSWPNAFAYYCPNPGWSYSLYYGGYCGWRWQDWDWCDWGQWYWPTWGGHHGSRWAGWHSGHPGHAQVYPDRRQRSWDRTPGPGRGWDRRSTHATDRRDRGRDEVAPAPAPERSRSADRYREPSRERHASSRGHGNGSPGSHPRRGDRFR